MFQGLFDGLLAAVQLGPLFGLLLGVSLGMVVGAIPGLSGTMAVALAIPFTYGLDPLTALAVLAGIHNGASQGGAIPAILLNIPGATGSVATAWDGYPLTLKGFAASAIRLSAASSAVGGMLSALSLVLLAPPLATAALAFGPPEVFWVNVFGLMAVSMLIGDDFFKGIASASLGLLIGIVGVDNVTGQERFTFNIIQFEGGIPELVVMVGLFSLPPTLALAGRAKFGATTAALQIGKAAKKAWTVATVWRSWLRASILGIILGIIPGSGGGVFIAYSEARRVSKHPEEFGHGSVEGLAAVETVNNADNAASMIPALTLGVPGGAIAALMLGALLIHGLEPGPGLFRSNPDVVYGYAWQMFIGSLLLIPLGGVLASRIFVQALRVPPKLLMPMIVAMMVLGTFAYQNSIFHVYMMLGFGVLGLLMERFAFPLPPLIIGLVLGVPAEYNLRVSLLISHGDPTIIFTRPLSLVVIALIIALIVYTIVTKRRERQRSYAS